MAQIPERLSVFFLSLMCGGRQVFDFFFRIVRFASDPCPGYFRGPIHGE